MGIFEHVTRPRLTAAITGLTPDRDAVKGDYRFVDESPMSEGLTENVEFFDLTYLDPEDVEISAASLPTINDLESAGERHPCRPQAWRDLRYTYQGGGRSSMQWGDELPAGPERPR